MTKKDFKLIALILAGHNVFPRQRNSRDELALSFADALEQVNPRFNRERFLAACGVGTDGPAWGKQDKENG